MTEEEGNNRAAYTAFLYIAMEDAIEVLRGILLWCVNACINAEKTDTTLADVQEGFVTREQLEYIARCLSQPGFMLPYAAEGGDDIRSFMENYFQVQLMAAGQPAEMEAGVFPMFPDFCMTLCHNGQETEVETGDKKTENFLSDGEAGIPMAELVFSDYICMVARSVLQEIMENCEEIQQVKELEKQLSEEIVRKLFGMTARFMLGGLSLPAPEDEEGQKNQPLYKLTGQLFSLPELQREDDYEITLSSSRKSPAICFVGSRCGQEQSVTVKLDKSEIERIEDLQRQVFSPALEEAPQEAQLYMDIPRSYSLESRLNWERSVYLFPEPLRGVSIVRKFPGEYMPEEPDNRIYLENQFQLVGYRLTEENGFMPAEALSPIGPTDQEAHAGDWCYDFVIPLAKHVEGGQENNPYSGLGQTAKLQLEWQDIFGCRVKGDSYSVEFPLCYTDELIVFSKWPGCLENAKLGAAFYKKVKYQLEQPSVKLFLHNSLYLSEDGASYEELETDKQFFVDYAAALQDYLCWCCLYLQAEIEGNPSSEYYDYSVTYQPAAAAQDVIKLWVYFNVGQQLP